MSVRFVIGRAGAGKTHHCLDAIRRELNDSPVAGPRLVMLAPEQASLQMERALLAGEFRAVARAEVLSFRRMAFRILEAAGRSQAARQVVSPAARAMVLRTIIHRLAPNLRYYKRVERLTGFLERLGRTVGEFIEEDVAPADLHAAQSAAATEPVRAAKLGDLASIYDAYLEYLGEDRVDASQHLQLARTALRQSEHLRGALVWVDGFAGFTGQEMLLLTELAGRADSMDITLLMDPDAHAETRTIEDIHPEDLFAKTQRTYLALLNDFARNGIEVSSPLILAPGSPPRFLKSPTLARLESALAAGTGSVRHAPDSSTAPTDVHLIEATDRRSEVEFVVAQVSNLVQKSQGAIRYRDIALIVRDLEPYHDLLSAALTERGIPYFIDRRRPIAHHPLVELLRGAMAVAATSFTVDAVRLLLKTGLLGLNEEASDELENYILSHGITGAAAWTDDDWHCLKKVDEKKGPTPDQQEHLRRVNAARAHVVERLDAFLALAESAHTGDRWASVLRELLDAFDAGRSLERWALLAEADGDVELAAQHRQTWTEVNGFIDDLGSALEPLELKLDELAPIVEAGLAQLSLGLVPPTVDQVLVGSIERSRHPEIKVAVILGFNDGMFPLLGSEDSILNDDDRTFLRGRKVQIGVTHRQRILDEALLVYVAMSRPSEKLMITYAASDADGKMLRPSPFVPQIRRALPGLKTRVLGDPFRNRSTWTITTAHDLAEALAAEMSRRPSLEEDDPRIRRRWNTIYVAARERPTAQPALRRALAALTYRNDASLRQATVDRLLKGTYTASVSELESYAACPFQRFARFSLRLKEREEASLRATDVGTAHHAILEDFLNDCLARKQDLHEVSDADLLVRLEDCAKRLGAQWERWGAASTARDAYILARSALDLSPIVRAQQRVARSGLFRPRLAEKKYGFSGDPGSLPPLEINTPAGRRVLLRGVIDRVDLAELSDEVLGVVVDYKRTRDKRLDLSNVYHGLSLQLLGYLLVLADRGETLSGRPIIPVAAFYVSLLRKYKPVEHPDEAPDPPEEVAPRGVLDSSRLELLDNAAPPIGWSTVFKSYRKKDGSLGYVDFADATSPRQFAALLQRTRRKLGELADGVLDGTIDVSPYRLGGFSPCHWCVMQSVCRFEFGDPGMRHLDAMKRSEVLRRVEEEAESSVP